MRTTLFIASLLFCHFAVLQARAQQGPNTYGVNGQNETLYDIYFANDTAGWVVGDSGVIGHWVPSNKEWVSQQSGTDQKLRSVHFPVEDTGWAVGDSGVVLHTEDGGMTWNSQTNSSSVDLYGVFFTDTDSGWTVGNSGTIYSTKDAGTNWTPQTSGTDMGLKAIEFVNDSIGWAVGDTGITLRTSDGGSNWNLGASAPDTLFDLSFLNDTLGWACGRKHLIVKSDDGGATWTVQQDATAPGFNLRSIQMLDSQKGVTFGIVPLGIAGFYRSNYWEFIPSDNFQRARSHHFFSIDTGWSVSRDSIHYFTDADSIDGYDGLEERNEVDTEVKVHPNPFQEQTLFRFKGTENPRSFSLYTLQGRQVRSERITKRRRYVLDRKGLPDGVYIYRFVNEKGGLASGRIVAR